MQQIPFPIGPAAGHLLAVFLVAIAMTGSALRAAEAKPGGWAAASAALEQELTAKYGGAQAPRIHRGIEQVAAFWRDEDGDVKAFQGFVRENFAGDPKTLDTLFQRILDNLEALDGHMNEIVLAFKAQSALDRGPILPFDEVFAGYDPAAHAVDDFFANKLAFVVLLNFPMTTLEQRLNEGAGWSRREWAEARLARRFARRVPAEVNLEVARATAEAEAYVAGYNIWMHHLLDDQGARLRPPKQRLLSHGHRRDETKAH